MTDTLPTSDRTHDRELSTTRNQRTPAERLLIVSSSTVLAVGMTRVAASTGWRSLCGPVSIRRAHHQYRHALDEVGQPGLAARPPARTTHSSESGEGLVLPRALRSLLVMERFCQPGKIAIGT
jgi:hypothetical protein